MKTTAFEIDVLEHTSRTGRYVTDEAAVIDMGRRGLLRDHGPQPIASGMHYFTLVEAGRKALAAHHATLPKPKPATRAQTRYQDFLRADCGLRFIDWLKRRSARTH